MDHNDHKSVRLAEAKPPLSDLRALESSGELWRVLESSGGGKTAAAPSTFTLGLRIRQVGRKYPPFKIVFWS